MSDFKAKMHQIRFRLGLRLRTRWWSLQRSPDPLARFRGPTSKGREGKVGKGREGPTYKGTEMKGGRGGEEGGGDGREKDGRGGEGKWRGLLIRRGR